MKRERKRKEEKNSNASQEGSNARNEHKVSTQNRPIDIGPYTSDRFFEFPETGVRFKKISIAIDNDEPRAIWIFYFNYFAIVLVRASDARARTVCFRLHYALCARPKFEQNIWRIPIRSNNTRRQIFKNDINDSGNNTDWMYRAHASRIKRFVYSRRICWNNTR